MNRVLLSLLLVCVLITGTALADKNAKGLAFDKAVVLKDADDTAIISSTNTLGPVTATPAYSADFYANSADNEIGVVVSVSAWVSSTTLTIEGSNDGTVYGVPTASNVLDTTKDAIYVTHTIAATGDFLIRFKNYGKAKNYRLKFSGGECTIDHLSICKQ